jgi:hypothetical protein
MDELLQGQIELQNFAFEVMDAKKRGQREVSIDDYEELLNAYIDVSRNYNTIYEILQDSHKRYDELYNITASIFGLETK